MVSIMTQTTKYLITAVSLALCVCTYHTHASESATARSNGLHISATRINFMRETGHMVLEENVEVFFDNVQMYADRVVAHQSQEREGEFDKIVATGNVRIITEDRHVRGQRAVYLNTTRTIRITGDSMVHERGGGIIRADAITYNIVQDTVSFEGRARAQMQLTDEQRRQYSTF